MSYRVLVTGISGFVGGHVALQLLNAGYTVRGSLRNMAMVGQVRETLANAGADITRLEFVALDLMSDVGWMEAMQDVRVLHHVASPFVLETPKDKMELIAPAVGGTERALNAALAADVERIVVTSSIAAIVYGHKRDRTEKFDGRDWTNLQGTHVPPYQESKTLAEQRAWAIMDAAGRRRDLVAINPAGVLGPLLNNDPGTSASVILQMLMGKIPMLPRIGFPVVDVRDVAAAHVGAMTAAEVGGCRIPLSENTLPFSAVARILAEAYPTRKFPKREMPDWFVRILSPFNRNINSLAAELGSLRMLDTKEAVALLGRPLITARQAILETASSLIAHGLLR